MSLLQFIINSQKTKPTNEVINEQIIINGDSNELDNLPISFSGIYEPQVIYHNGETLISTQRSDLASDGNPIVFKFDNNLNYEFGEILDNTSPINFHNTATIYVDDQNYIYCLYPRHGQSSRLYKSTFPNNVKTWSLHTTIGQGQNLNYPTIVRNYQGSYFYIARLNINQIAKYSGSSDLLTWNNLTTITEQAQSEPNSTNFRHYPLYVADGLYNNYTYLNITKRITLTVAGTPNTYMRLWVLRTQDFDTIESVDGTWSKTITSLGELTESELNSNCLANEQTNFSDNLNTFNFAKVNHINGQLYYYRTETNFSFQTTGKFIGYFNGTVWVDKDITTTLTGLGLADLTFLTNGDIEFWVRDSSGPNFKIDKYITSDLFDSITYQETVFDQANGTFNVKLPFNYQTIPNGVPTLMAGGGFKDNVVGADSNSRFNDLQIERIVK